MKVSPTKYAYWSKDRKNINSLPTHRYILLQLLLRLQLYVLHNKLDFVDQQRKKNEEKDGDHSDYSTRTKH